MDFVVLTLHLSEIARHGKVDFEGIFGVDVLGEFISKRYFKKKRELRPERYFLYELFLQFSLPGCPPNLRQHSGIGVVFGTLKSAGMSALLTVASSLMIGFREEEVLLWAETPSVGLRLLSVCLGAVWGSAATFSVGF